MTTSTLDTITNTLCRNDDEVNAVYAAIKSAATHYQWEYQNASKRQYRDISTANTRTLEEAIAILKGLGQNTTASSIEDTLSVAQESLLTESKTLTAAKRMLKRECTSTRTRTISTSRYNRDFAALMIEAWKEWCEAYPIQMAPEGTDINWQPDEDTLRDR